MRTIRPCIAITVLALLSLNASAQSADPATPLPDTPVAVLPGRADFIRFSPDRTLNHLMSLMPGVVLQNGALHIRGGRADEVHYRVNGHPATNPFTNRPLFEVIPEAVEFIHLRSGPADGDFGRALSGEVHSVMRTGGRQLAAHGALMTDELVDHGNTLGGLRSYGHREAVLTIEGPFPMLDGATFLVAGRHRYMRDRSPAFLTPFSITPVSLDPARPFPGPLTIDARTFGNNTGEENTIQGTLGATSGPLAVHLTGHASWEHFAVGAAWPLRLERAFSQGRNPEQQRRTGFLGITSTYQMSSRTVLSWGGSYAAHRATTVDPVFDEQWQLYTDSAANARAGYDGFSSRWVGPSAYYAPFGFSTDDPRTPNNAFMKQAQSGWSVAADVRHTFDASHSMEAGVTWERWTTRMYEIARIGSMMAYAYGSRGTTPRSFRSEAERYWLLPRLGRLNNYGYDVLGNAADDGLSAPYSPGFGTAFIRHRWQNDGLSVTSTLRYEYYYTDIRPFRDPNAVPVRYVNDVSGTYEMIPEEALQDPTGHHHILPQLLASYTSGIGATVTAGFGTYAQLPSLDQLYLGAPLALLSISPVTRGNAYNPPVGSSAGPERAWQIEASVTHPLGTGMTAGIRGYTRHMWDLLTVRYQPVQRYVRYVNGDEANAKGIEVSLAMVTGDGLSAFLGYALSEVRGNGSHPRTAIGPVENPPPAGADSLLTGLSRLDYDQTHRATLLVSYRAPGQATGLLSGIGFQAQLTYNSGHHYSPLYLPLVAGSAAHLMKGVDQIEDPRFARPLVPTGAAKTPAVFNCDLAVSKRFILGGSELELFAQVLNLFDTRHVLNVYPTTGSAADDGFLGSDRAAWITADPRNSGFTDFYRAVNSENRWSYQRATGEWYNREQLSGTGSDLYGTPRQFRVGIRLTIGAAGSGMGHAH